MAKVLKPNIDERMTRDWLTHFCVTNGVIKLSIFGSVLRDDFHMNSDIDILVEYEADANVGYIQMMRMQSELTEVLGIQVDLRTAAELSRSFRDRVLNEAKVMYVH